MTKLTCCEIKERSEKLFNKIILEIRKESKTPEAFMKIYENINHFYKELINELLRDGCEGCEE